jgi:hypothetical protein
VRDAGTLGSGVLAKLSVEASSPAAYVMSLENQAIDMNALIGSNIEICFTGHITCCHCGVETRRSYGGGHCYACFKTLASCDLCVVSPDRCHFFEGTCREPDWGESFCMQPHLVYLANSAGLKVGITKPSQVPVRWLDQGASQALIILRTATRQQAGLVEAALAQTVRDRTDWRALVAGEARAVDLDAARGQLARQASAALTALDRRYPGALQPADDEVARVFSYPVSRYPRQFERFTLDTAATVRGRLVGIKGQYLLFDTGVFNVRQHTSYHVQLSVLEDAWEGESQARSDTQLDLF